MFTGLIEDVGKIGALRLNNGAAVLTVKTRLAVRSMALGASVAVNGACLTVVKKGTGAFTVDVSPETLARTNLAQLAVGGLVNLEQPMRLQDRLGGHLVTGHVDGVGSGRSDRESRANLRFFTFPCAAPPRRASGIRRARWPSMASALRLTNAARRQFSVAIIPFTLRHTNLRGRRVGDKVNIETDLIGKYVHSFMQNAARLLRNQSESSTMPISTIEEGLEEIRNGRMVILVNEDAPESDGFFCLAAEKVTAESINYMLHHGRGIIYVTLTDERIRELWYSDGLGRE